MVLGAAICDEGIKQQHTQLQKLDEENANKFTANLNLECPLYLRLMCVLRFAPRIGVAAGEASDDRLNSAIP